MLLGVFSDESLAHRHAAEWTALVGGQVDTRGVFVQYCHSEDDVSGNNLAAFVTAMEIDSTIRIEKSKKMYLLGKGDES